MYVYWSILLLAFHACSTFSLDVTYEELEELDAVCHTLDNCKTRRGVDSLDRYTCHCSRDCSTYGTCCVDASSRDRRPPRRKQSCRSVSENQYSYFMVDYCPSNRNRNSIYKTMCEEDPPADDLMSLVPVTSLSTNRTYKNFFCFKCNEETEKFLYWNIKMNGSADSPKQIDDTDLAYDKGSKSWIAPVGKKGNNAPVILLFDIPEDITTLPKICVPDVISSCSKEFRNGDIKQKCGMYASYIYIIKGEYKVAYRNPHCALCNFEDLVKMECGVQTGLRTTEKKRPFSFALLMDINTKDGDKVGYITRCSKDSVWDPFFEKCRTLKCAIPGYVVRGGKCVAP